MQKWQVMGLVQNILRELRFGQGMVRTWSRITGIGPDSPNLICDDFERAVNRYRNRQAMTFEGQALTYGELDDLANRFAHWAQAQHLVRGDCVALFMPNRMEYLAIWMGLAKVGVVTALINNNLTGPALAHCLNLSGARHVIADSETIVAYLEVEDSLTKKTIQWQMEGSARGHTDLVRILKTCSSLRPDRKALREGLKAKDLALYIFTSGTTGMPKAAKISHARVQFYMRGFAGATGARASDRVYVTLPLYHATGGLCATGATLLNGGCVVLRRRFSLSQFWDEVRSERCTMFVYIGELCRYLVNQDPVPGERGHNLRMAFGNGLRPDVWDKMTQRFAIPEILEFYGSTEGNVSMFNFDGKAGAIGRVPAYLESRFNFKLVQFDVETEQPVRGPDGRCIPCRPGEVGECIGEISKDARTEFSGYADKAASAQKILTDVMAAGDRWFRTGDLMRVDHEGYFYFVDRIGETFRWKGENVSTTEVAQQIAGFSGVHEAIVYGVPVPGSDGRAGMTSLVVGEEFDLDGLTGYLESRLPSFAQPLFIRLQPQMEITGTFKYRKIDLVQQGFDPAVIDQPLFFKQPGAGYVPLTPDVFAKIGAGAFKL